ncbi:MAG: septum site-determining protein MinD [Candidatus Wallbacteria bacterium]
MPENNELMKDLKNINSSVAAGGEKNPQPSEKKERYAKVYTIVSGKGGVGKTTISANLAMGLSLLGKKVLLIDGDAGLKNLEIIMGLEEHCNFDITQCINGEVKFAAACVQDPRASSLYFITASQTADKKALSPEKMAEFCHSLMKDFDYIIIDAPAGIENGFFCAVAPATHAIVVTTPEHTALRNSDKITGLLESAGILTKNISLIINKIETQLIAENLSLEPEQIQKVLKLPLIGQIPFDYDITVSNFKKRPVVLNGRAFAAELFLNIAKYIDGEKVKVISLKKLTFIDKLLQLFSR